MTLCDDSITHLEFMHIHTIPLGAAVVQVSFIGRGVHLVQ